MSIRLNAADAGGRRTLEDCLDRLRREGDPGDEDSASPMM